MRRILPLLIIALALAHFNLCRAQNAPQTYRPVSVTLPLNHAVISAGMNPLQAINALHGVALAPVSSIGEYLTLKGEIGDTSHAGPNYSLVLNFAQDRLEKFSIYSSDETDLEPWLAENIAQLPQNASTKHEVDSSAAGADSSVMGDLALTTTETWSSPDVTWSVAREDFVILTVTTYTAEFKLKP